MADFSINDFTAGWIPCEDPVNGRKNGLLQMDNLELDTNGALSLAGGTAVKQSGFPANAHTLYSGLVNGARADYALLTDGSIYRNNTSIGSGGDATNGAFGSAFNFTLIASGNKRLKDDGTTVSNLGIGAPSTALTIAYSTSNSPYAILGDVTNNTIVPTGYGSSSVIGSYVQMTANAGGQWILQTYGGGGPYNLNQMVGVSSDIGYATDEDYIQIVGYTPIVAGRSLNVDVLLVAGNSAGDVVSDYYTYQIGELSAISYSAIDGSFTWRMRRKDFIRVGTGSQDWSTVYGFRISYSGGAASEVVNILGNGTSSPVMYMIGGDNAQNGQYQYVQVNVYNTGSYNAKSVAGPVSKVINLDMGQTLVTPYVTGIDSQVNEIWIYRRGGDLNEYYRVKTFVKSGSWGSPSGYDTFSDADAIALNIKLNLNLISIDSSSVSDKIYEIIGPVNNRWLYFTTNYLYPSEPGNPDLVDSSIAIRITGSNSELFLWARQVSDNTILVATNLGMYTFSGTFSTFPDQTIDAYYRPIKCKFPAITCDAEVFSGSVYYLSNDGWRLFSLDGSNPSLVSPNLDKLYRGETVGAYVGPNLKVVPRSVRFPLVIAKNKMFCFITGLGTPRIEVYDFIRQYWRPVLYGLGDVTAACSTQDGQVLAFFADKKTREIGLSSSKLIDATTKQLVAIKTMVFDGGTPLNRKDSSSLKIRLSNSDNTTLSVIVDGSATINAAGTATANTVVTQQNFDLSAIPNVAICKTYQLSISATVNAFLLDDININYDLRPEQRHFIRVQSTNYGIVSRKRLYSIPFQIDSLSNNVTLTPYVDNVAQTPLIVNSSYKKSYDYQFPLVAGEVVRGIDYEYTLHSTGLFEFFGFSEPKNIEVYPEGQLSYIIPVNNFGTPNKKRLRVWPFVLSSLTNGNLVTFTPIVDGVTQTPTIFTVYNDKRTYFYFFKTDVFGVDYSGSFSSVYPFEVNQIMNPDIVQVLPIARRFDQLGPEEFFRYGKLKQIELRVLAYGVSIPYTIYFNDTTIETGAFTTTYGKEDSYYIMVPKGTSGRIVRVELGPTDFDFHRFYMRFLVTRSGRDTDLEWIQI